MTDYEVVTSYLNSLNIHYSKDWVLKCINGVKSSNSFLSCNDLCSAVYQKWLLVNLRELKVPSLPANLLSREKVTLTGSYAVQMESMLNSAKSSYSELCRIRDPDKVLENFEESKEEDSSKRCLVFIFCDGVQEIQGMEYQPLPSFNLNDPGILPGIKILIVGPVVCRKGMLLLKKENVKIYGGKVESLCETNCFESLLCKELGLSPDFKDNNHKKTAVTRGDMSSCEVNSDVAGSSSSKPETSNVIPEDVVDELLSDDDDILVSLKLDSNSFDDDNFGNTFSEIKGNNITDKGEVTKKINMNSEVLMDETENQLLNNVLSSDVCKKNQREEEIPDGGRWKKPKISESGFGDDICEEEIALQDDFMDEDVLFDSVLNPSENKGSQNFDVASSHPDLDAKNFQLKNSSHLSSVRRENCQFNNSHRKFPLTVSSHPFVYLKQISDVALSKPVIFIVKAIILTLKSKIIMKNDEFALKAVISDGSYAIQADFSSEILENIIEYSPCEIASFMSEKKNNSAVGDKLKCIFSCAQQKLLSMNCLMKLKFFNDGHAPLIIGLEEIQLHHVNALKQRMWCS